MLDREHERTAGDDGATDRRHVGIVPDGKPSVPATAYLYVEDADELAKEWTSAGGIVHPPQDTEWGQREGVLIDPDGNIIRFGSPLLR